MKTKPIKAVSQMTDEELCAQVLNSRGRPDPLTMELAIRLHNTLEAVRAWREVNGRIVEEVKQ